MTVPASLNLDEVQGDDWTITLDFVDANGYAIDYSASSFTATIRRSKTKNSPIAATFTVDQTDAATGRVVLTLSSAVSELLTAKYYYYDIQEENYFSQKTTLIGGKITLQREITE